MSADAIFEALGDPMRRRLVTELSSIGQASSTDLAQRLPISRQAVSKHLELLASAGLVSRQRAGRAVVWNLTPESFTDAMSWMTEVGSAWDRRLAALRRHLAR